MKRVQIDTNVYEQDGHEIHRFNGPKRWAEVITVNGHVLVRHGYLPSVCRESGMVAAHGGHLPVENKFYDEEELQRALNAARRYARKKS